MILRLALASAALLALSAPAQSQEAVPAPSAPTATAPAVTEADIEAAGEAFGLKMEAMGAEIATAVTAANGDMVKARADTDPIVARYQPDADAFAAIVTGFFAAMPDGPEKAQMTAMAPMIEAEIKSAPAKARDQALAPATPAATPAPQ